MGIAIVRLMEGKEEGGDSARSKSPSMKTADDSGVKNRLRRFTGWVSESLMLRVCGR